MSGTFFLPSDHRWSSSGWIYDNVLERMATILVSKNSSVADKVLEARTEVNGGYLDFRETDTETLRLLLHAATEAYEQFKAEGAGSFHMPEFYPCFMGQFDELIAILHSLAGTDR
jgi:hypothetical protein